MKKLLFLILVVSFFLLARPLSAQQDSLSVTPSVVTPTPIPDVPGAHYQLPYPGILPDNPLYFLKTARDRIISFFVSDPLKKSDLDLLEADKRLNAAIYLLQEHKEKDALAESTVTKAENYFGEGIDKLIEAKQRGMDITDRVRTMLDAAAKHKMVLESMKKSINQKQRGSILKSAERVDAFEKTLGKLSVKKQAPVTH